jgi:uncharacterized membrane protein
MDERHIHQAFQLSVLPKGTHALLECVGGIALAIVGTGTTAALVNALTRDELIGNRRDVLATHLAKMAETLSVSGQYFCAFYLLSHGAVKIFLAWGLLTNRTWAYPTSVIVLALFITYQLCRFTSTHSPGLIAPTVLDLVVMVRIRHEYRLIRHHGLVPSR